nr:hypothetical protein [Tanacetum cinerariifolium]GEW24441.1 hypothetical protein [Tanacetum cinerariifolium]
MGIRIKRLYDDLRVTPAQVKHVNEEAQLHDMVDGKRVVISEASIRSDLRFRDKGDEAVYEEMYDIMERAATTATGLDVEQDRGIISKTQFTVTLNEPSSIGTSSGSGPMRQETIGDAAAQTSLGDQEDASKQEMIINNLDADEGVTLVDETQGRNDQDMFDTGLLDYEEVVSEKEVSTDDLVTTAGEVVTTADVKDSAAFTTIIISMDDVTLAKALAALKSAKPMVKEPSIPKAKGIVMQEPEETTIRTTTVLSQNHELAERLQAEEQGELTIEERSKLFVELMNKRKKHFERLRADEKRRKSPTKAQNRNHMCTYLKNMVGFTHNQLKNKSFKEVQKAFDNTISWINSFVPMDIEVTKGSYKRAGEELKSDKSKKQNMMSRRNEMFGYILLVKIKHLGRIAGIKILYDDLRVTAAQVLSTSDDEEETQEDEFVHTPENYVPTNDENVDDEEYEHTNKEMYDDVNVELKDAETADEGKSDEEMTDAEKIDSENENVNQKVSSDQVNDDAQEKVTAALATQKTKVPLESSFISSDYAMKFLNFDNIPSADTEIISLMDIKVQHKDPSSQTTPILTIPVLTLRNVDHSSAIHVAIKSEVPIVVKEYLGASLENTIHKKITLFETMTKTKSFNKTTKHKALYHALMESILEDEDAIDKGVTDRLKKRKPDDVDRDEGPPTGPDQGLKRKKMGKDTKPSKKANSTKTSKGTTKSQPKLTSKSAQAEETMFEAGDTQVP